MCSTTSIATQPAAAQQTGQVTSTATGSMQTPHDITQNIASMCFSSTCSSNTGPTLSACHSAPAGAVPEHSCNVFALVGKFKQPSSLQQHNTVQTAPIKSDALQQHSMQE
jgi:hypothetical protein